MVYILHAGQMRARPTYRRHLGQSGCAVGARLEWHGRFLLYDSTDGGQAVLDTQGRWQIGLTHFIQQVPQRGRSKTVNGYWQSDLAHS